MSTDANASLPDAAAALAPAGAVVRLLPVAVLVVSEDRYFRSAATMLLSRRGCSVLAAANEAEALAQAAAHVVDVLVVEPAPCFEPTQPAFALASLIDATCAAVGRRVAPVGVIVVGEPERLGEALDAEARTPLPVLDKWGPFERLYQAICERDRARRLPAAVDVERRPGALRGLGV